jgi:hypothetical protein
MSSFGRIRHAALPDGQISMMDFAGLALPRREKAARNRAPKNSICELLQPG